MGGHFNKNRFNCAMQVLRGELDCSHIANYMLY